MDPRSIAKEKRHGAERARRMVAEVRDEDDKARILAFAAELEAQAEALEQVAGQVAGRVQQQQQQAQQQGPLTDVESPTPPRPQESKD